MTTDNSRADALTDEQRSAIGYAARMLEQFSDGRATAAIRTLSAMLTASPVEQPAAAPIHPDVLAHIKWLHYCLREAGHCIDGGTCHHECGAKGECWRQDGCVPLTGSRLTDDWKLPAPSPADGRAAFEAALDKRAKSAGFEVGRMTECELDNARWGWQAGVSFANETGEEGAKPIYQLQQVNGAWRDVTESEYRSIGCDCARIVYAAPQPAQADARVGLTEESINTFAQSLTALSSWHRDYVANELHAFLTAHLSQPEPRAESSETPCHNFPCCPCERRQDCPHK
jgi:hypothetical protein